MKTLSIAIPSANLSACLLGCNQQVVLYQLNTDAFSAFSSGANSATQQSQATVLSWFSLRGSQPVYRQGSQTPLTVAITVPKTQSPSDLVTIGVSVKGGSVGAATFVNLIVTDE